MPRTRSRITLWDRDFGRGHNGADALSNVEDAAAGRASRRSGGSSTFLDDQLVSAMVALADDQGFDYFVTCITGAFHSANSLHYAGRPFEVDGVRINGPSAKSDAFAAACRRLGAIEVIGPVVGVDNGHWDHIHCGF